MGKVGGEELEIRIDEQSFRWPVVEIYDEWWNAIRRAVEQHESIPGLWSIIDDPPLNPLPGQGEEVAKRQVRVEISCAGAKCEITQCGVESRRISWNFWCDSPLEQARSGPAARLGGFAAPRVRTFRCVRSSERGGADVLWSVCVATSRTGKRRDRHKQRAGDQLSHAQGYGSGVAGLWPGRTSQAKGYTRAWAHALLDDRHQHDQECATLRGRLRARPDGNRA